MPIMPDWRELLRSDGYELMPGTHPDAIDAVEAALGMQFPGELRSLYLASDGVFDTSGQWWVIWPLGMLAEENERRRRAGVLPADLIAFGDDGTGDPFRRSRSADGEGQEAVQIGGYGMLACDGVQPRNVMPAGLKLQVQS